MWRVTYKPRIAALPSELGSLFRMLVIPELEESGVGLQEPGGTGLEVQKQAF